MKFNTKIKQKIIDKHLSSDWLKAHPGLSTLSLAEIQCRAPQCKRECGVHHEGGEEPPHCPDQAD